MCLCSDDLTLEDNLNGLRKNNKTERYELMFILRLPPLMRERERGREGERERESMCE